MPRTLSIPRLCRFAALATSVVLSAASCERPAPDTAPDPPASSAAVPPIMKLDPVTFASVVPGSPEPNACSPRDPGPGWRGIALRLPTRVKIGSGEEPDIIPLCGFYRVDLTADTSAGILVVVREPAADDKWTARLIDDDPSPEEPPPTDDPPLDPAIFEGMSTAGYFNPDLLKLIRLPERAGSYQVHVEFGGHRSEPATLEVITD